MLDGEGVGAAPEVEPTVEAPTSESSGTDGAAEPAGDAYTTSSTISASGVIFTMSST